MCPQDEVVRPSLYRPTRPGISTRSPSSGVPAALLSNGPPAVLWMRRCRVWGSRRAGCRPVGLGDWHLQAESGHLSTGCEPTGPSPPGPFRVGHQIPGTPTPPRHSGCKWSGVAATVSGGSGCPARPTSRSGRSPSCHRWWALRKPRLALRQPEGAGVRSGVAPRQQGNGRVRDDWRTT